MDIDTFDPYGYNYGYTKDIHKESAMKIASKIFALGNSNAVRIPKNALQSLRLHADDPIEIEVENDRIIIIRAQDSKLYPSVDDLFFNYSGEYIPVEMDCGNAVGKEML